MTEEEKAASQARREAVIQAWFDAEDGTEGADRGSDHRMAEPTPTKAAPGWYRHPTMAATLAYWDGNGWTDHVAPAGTGSTAAPRSGSWNTSPDVDRDEPAFAWTIAVMPALWLPFDYFMPEFSTSGYAFFLAVVLVGILASWDAKRLASRGVDVSAVWGFLLVPVYLIQRTLRAGSTPFIPIAWFFCAAISVLGAFTFAAVYELDGTEVADSIERNIERSLPGDVAVRCPDEMVRDGDVVWCTVRSGGFTEDVRVQVIGDGSEFSYEWEVR